MLEMRNGSLKLCIVKSNTVIHWSICTFCDHFVFLWAAWNTEGNNFKQRQLYLETRKCFSVCQRWKELQSLLHPCNLTHRNSHLYGLTFKCCMHFFCVWRKRLLVQTKRPVLLRWASYLNLTMADGGSRPILISCTVAKTGKNSSQPRWLKTS